MGVRGRYENGYGTQFPGFKCDGNVPKIFLRNNYSSLPCPSELPERDNRQLTAKSSFIF